MPLTRYVILALTTALALGCKPGEPGITSFTIDPVSGPPGTEVVATIEVENFELTGEQDGRAERGAAFVDTAEVSTDHEGHEHEDDEGGAPGLGHVHVYWDSFESNPLTQMEHATAVLVIPSDAEPGPHVLMARLHGADHLIIEPQVVAEAEFLVDE